MRNSGLVISMCLAFPLLSCWNQEEYEWRDLKGGTDCFVVLFHEAVEPREIFEFLQKKTNSSTPHPSGGYYPRDGIAGFVSHRVQGHAGYEICFAPAVTAENRAAILDDMAGASLVYGIYENVDPAEIVLE